ncbi:hypothetical protein ASE08_28065 [Rhizobacter sp. Root16D2]|nr:hypothetical protein ASC88_03610 [Rhizobacter sp. Root29]KQW02468.1 hypothetical protein ASC98_28165 [Rhizobacter sp. Root1238]KRB12541.1 hypothetical protein ASE08_28065 [Rhizobacter sp. Root16D2]
MLPAFGSIERDETLFSAFGAKRIAELCDLSAQQQEQAYVHLLDSLAPEAPRQPKVVPSYRDTFRTKEVPSDGDCFFHSLIEVAPDELRDALGTAPTPRAIRCALADQLADGFMQLNAATDDAQVQQLLDDKPYLATVEWSPGACHLTPAQQQMVEQVRTSGSWNHDAGDLCAALVVHWLRKLQLEIVTGYASAAKPIVFGAGRRVRVALDGAHYRPIRCSAPPARPT